jgi:hypothetical protein
MSLDIYKKDSPPKPLDKKELQLLKQNIAIKPKSGKGKDQLKMVPLTEIVGKKYGKHLPKWWIALIDGISNDMYMLDFFKGGEVILYRPSKDDDWGYAIYRGVRRSLDDSDGSDCKGRTERIYYFQTALNELGQIKYHYISPEIAKKCGSPGGSWSGGEIALFQQSQFP